MPKHIPTGTSDKSLVYEVAMDGEMCIQKCFHRSKDCERELKIMQVLNGKRHFPSLIKTDRKSIWMRHHGALLRNRNCPKDYKEQLRTIVHSLADLDLYHNDVWKNNMVVDAAGTITLIDFGFGSWKTSAYPQMNLSLKLIDKASSIEDLYHSLWCKRA